MHKILVVDDDQSICHAIEQLLKHEGYQVIVAHNGQEAIEIIEANPIDLMIIDIMMPMLDGLSTTLTIRKKRNFPIIMLSAKSEDSDKILGLGMGADDYICKPYNPQELVARVNSQIRRFKYLGSHDNLLNNAEILKCGGLELNLQTKEAIVDGLQVKLTATEYGILELLMKHPSVVFSVEQIYESVWGNDAFGIENTVMVHIRHIREKIEIAPKEPKYLKVVWGIGYKIEKN